MVPSKISMEPGFQERCGYFLFPAMPLAADERFFSLYLHGECTTPTNNPGPARVYSL